MCFVEAGMYFEVGRKGTHFFAVRPEKALPIKIVLYFGSCELAERAFLSLAL